MPVSTNVDDKERAAALRSFLTERRGRLKPADVGLPSNGTRRCPGLRREEVAELIGVSSTWYTFFEISKPNHRFSVRMIDRVATALRLDRTDREALLRLAVPELGRVTSEMQRSTAAAAAAFAPLCMLAQRLAQPIAYDEAAAQVVATLRKACPDYTISERQGFGQRIERDLRARGVVVAADGSAYFAVRERNTLRAVYNVALSDDRGYAGHELQFFRTVAAMLEGVVLRQIQRDTGAARGTPMRTAAA